MRKKNIDFFRKINMNTVLMVENTPLSQLVYWQLIDLQNTFRVGEVGCWWDEFIRNKEISDLQS